MPNRLVLGLIRGGGGLLAAGGARGRLTILYYHRVLAAPDPLMPDEVDHARFDWQMGLLASCFNVLPLREAVTRLADDSLPPRAASVTFDDGYADNCEIALPILRKWGLRATFFVATGFLGGGCMWNDAVFSAIRHVRGPVFDLRCLGLDAYPVTTVTERRRAATSLIRVHKYFPSEERERRVSQILAEAGLSTPRDLMMQPGQVRKLYASGMDVGGHTVNHPILARLPADTARAEISEGKAALESIIGAPVHLFAYPNGAPNVDYTAEHARMVADCGFVAAVSTARGAATRSTSIFQLPRFTPWDRRPARFGARLLANYLRTSPSIA